LVINIKAEKAEAVYLTYGCQSPAEGWAVRLNSDKREQEGGNSFLRARRKKHRRLEDSRKKNTQIEPLKKNRWESRR